MTEAQKAERAGGGGSVGVIAATEDLMFRSRISEAADSLGIESKFPRSPKKLMEAVRSARPDVLVLDLHSERFDAVEILNELHADRELRSIRTIGYVPHTRKDLIVSAREAGCDRILARSAFFGGLPDVLLPKQAGGLKTSTADDEDDLQ